MNTQCRNEHQSPGTAMLPPGGTVAYLGCLMPYASRLKLIVFSAILLCSQLANAYWEQPVEVRFSGSELRDTLQQYAKIQQIGFLLDRRVDPGLRLEFETKDVSGREMFQNLARKMGLGFCEVGEIAYIGPKDAAEKLERLLALKSAVKQKISLKTKKLDTPRDILQNVAKKLRMKIVNPDVIPHDLWAELDFPEAEAHEILSVLLIGFDATYVVNGKEITLIPITSEILSRAVVERSETRNTASPRKTTTTKNVPITDLRFPLVEVKNKTVDEVLHYFADNLELSVEIDKKALAAKGISLEQRISFQLDQADIHELLRATLDPIGCTYQLTGKKLKVVPKK